jgi:hypothetical protein
MEKEYTQPKFRSDNYHCPHCGVYSHQDWYEVYVQDSEQEEAQEEITLSQCSNCKKYSIWIRDIIVYPETTTAPLPLRDTPEKVLTDYYEARDIITKSPRAAVALLRSALQKLISHLGGEGEVLEEKLENLKKRGMESKIQIALNSVRMTGEDAVTPGLIDIDDNEETAMILFNIINLLVDTLITQPKKVEELVDNLPGKKKDEKDYAFRAKIR